MSKRYQQMYPLSPMANGDSRSDEEAANLEAMELKRKKRIKYAMYFAVFVVFQTGIILLFALTVMKIRTPKVRVGSVTIENFSAGTTASPSFDMRLIAQVTVKNTNFGHYKFDASNVTFLYQGVTVGQAVIPKARARARSTKKLDVSLDLSSSALTSIANLGDELGSNVLTLNSEARLSGKVELMKVLKKKKSAEMSCSLTFDVSARTLQTLTCK